jgi:hypothetical protein
MFAAMMASSVFAGVGQGPHTECMGALMTNFIGVQEPGKREPDHACTHAQRIAPVVEQVSQFEQLGYAPAKTEQTRQECQRDVNVNLAHDVFLKDISNDYCKKGQRENS